MTPISHIALEAWANIPEICEGPEIDKVAWICVPGHPRPLPMYIQEEEIRAWTQATPEQRPYISVADLIFALTRPHAPQTSDELAHAIASLLDLPYHPKYTVFDPKHPEHAGDKTKTFHRRLDATLSLYGADALLLYWIQSRKSPLVIPINRIAAIRQTRPEFDTFLPDKSRGNPMLIGRG